MDMMQLCECGCGLPAPIAKQSRSQGNHIKGKPVRFIQNHHPIKHGQGKTGQQSGAYRSYISAKNRCTNPNNSHWKNYGGRGIKFLYTSFEQFFAELGPRPIRQTLDRKKNDGNYEPGNCQWASRKSQVHNRRKFGALANFTTEELRDELLRRQKT
jgi:hypothetical protein